MNIEQLEKGQELREDIRVVTNQQKELVDSYNSSNNKRTILIAFGSRSHYYEVGEDVTNQIFQLINNALMKKLINLEKEFSDL